MRDELPDVRAVLDDAIDAARRNEAPVHLELEAAEALRAALPASTDPPWAGDIRLLVTADVLSLVLRDYLRDLGAPALERLAAQNVRQSGSLRGARSALAARDQRRHRRAAT